MKVLLALPAANALNAAVLVQLFRAPCFAEDNNRPGQLTTSKYACLEKLAAVPAAGTAVGLMLQEALEAKCFESMLHIVGLPAAAQLSTFEVEQALEADVSSQEQPHSIVCLAMLLKLPAAGLLNSQQVAAALDAAMHRGAGIPRIQHVAAQFSTQQVAQLLQAAASLCSPACVRQLCKLPAAWHLSSKHVAQPLDAAVQRGDASCVKQLCKLPGANKLSRNAVSGLMQAAKQHDAEQCTKVIAPLLRLPGAANKQGVKVHKAKQKYYFGQPKRFG